VAKLKSTNLLRQVQSDALSVRNNADQLQARLREGFWSDWQSYANLLERMRTRVNAMDKLLFQLRTNESTALPWQRQAIERIAPTIVNLSDTTEGAIVSLNNNKEHVYMSNLPGLAGDMYDQAMRIDQAIADFQKYANARHEAQQLRQTLGLKNNS
jgi:hypothetical protein